MSKYSNENGLHCNTIQLDSSLFVCYIFILDFYFKRQVELCFFKCASNIGESSEQSLYVLEHLSIGF